MIETIKTKIDQSRTLTIIVGIALLVGAFVVSMIVRSQK